MDIDEVEDVRAAKLDEAEDMQVDEPGELLKPVKEDVEAQIRALNPCGIGP